MRQGLRGAARQAQEARRRPRRPPRAGGALPRSGPLPRGAREVPGRGEGPSRGERPARRPPAPLRDLPHDPVPARPRSPPSAPGRPLALALPAEAGGPPAAGDEEGGGGARSGGCRRPVPAAPEDAGPRARPHRPARPSKGPGARGHRRALQPRHLLPRHRHPLPRSAAQGAPRGPFGPGGPRAGGRVLRPRHGEAGGPRAQLLLRHRPHLRLRPGRPDLWPKAPQPLRLLRQARGARHRVFGQADRGRFRLPGGPEPSPRRPERPHRQQHPRRRALLPVVWPDLGAGGAREGPPRPPATSRWGTRCSPSSSRSSGEGASICRSSRRSRP